MAVERLLPTEEARDLLTLTREIASERLAPRAAADEAASAFPRDVFRLLGEAGLLALPYAEEFGGGEQPYEVYLQALEEIAGAWMSVGVGVSVHSLASWALATYGDDEQKKRLLPDMLGGAQLGAYCLSEPQAGSDIAAMTTKAVRTATTTCSPAPRRGSPTAARPTSTSCSHAPRPTAPGACRRSTCPPPRTGCRSGRPRRRWGSPAPRLRR